MILSLTIPLPSSASSIMIKGRSRHISNYSLCIEVKQRLLFDIDDFERMITPSHSSLAAHFILSRIKEMKILKYLNDLHRQSDLYVLVDIIVNDKKIVQDRRPFFLTKQDLQYRTTSLFTVEQLHLLDCAYKQHAEACQAIGLDHGEIIFPSALKASWYLRYLSDDNDMSDDDDEDGVVNIFPDRRTIGASICRPRRSATTMGAEFHYSRMTSRPQEANTPPSGWIKDANLPVASYMAPGHGRRPSWFHLLDSFFFCFLANISLFVGTYNL